MSILENGQKIVYENDDLYFYGKIIASYISQSNLFYVVKLEKPFDSVDHTHHITNICVAECWVKPIDKKVVFVDEWNVERNVSEYFNEGWNWENFKIGEKVYIQDIDFEFCEGIQCVLFNGIKNGIVNLL